MNRFGEKRGAMQELSPLVLRLKPRSYAEWRALRRWGKLPSWEETPAGYLLREAREAAGLTQASLAERLGTSQQAVAQAERPNGNPTVSFMRSWARACNAVLTLDVRRQPPPLG